MLHATVLTAQEDLPPINAIRMQVMNLKDSSTQEYLWAQGGNSSPMKSTRETVVLTEPGEYVFTARLFTDSTTDVTDVYDEAKGMRRIDYEVGGAGMTLGSAHPEGLLENYSCSVKVSIPDSGYGSVMLHMTHIELPPDDAPPNTMPTVVTDVKASFRIHVAEPTE